MARKLTHALDGPRVHLSHRDVTLMCFSRAPIDRLIAYKERMGWQFPYVSTYGTDFPFDFNLALKPEQAQAIPQIKEMLELIEFRVAQAGKRRVGEAAHDEVHFADAAMPGAESNAAAADLAVHLRRDVRHVNSFAAGAPWPVVYIVAQAWIVTRPTILKAA